MKKYLIELLGGFPDLDSAIQFIKKTNNETAKNAILTEVVKNLFNTISSEDILRYEDGEYIFQGRPLLPDELQQLKAEAEFFRKSKLWKVIDKDVKFQLNRKLYNEANITTDILWGKLILYYHDIINTRLSKFK